ncbi:hypothetical protein [Phaeodactylibacter sp.]|uniref:hypothetical protein n=1 Tax=Phaeodactylibacter sp. TaxID=1940289 RepID=UPI0025D666C5|nr:hypothetical protein [Phaeodactylibacter sp.]MCI5091151.1 hypothetical protein [Phaeodactylibacter sp.]
MSKDKQPPKDWVERVSGTNKAPNEDNNKARGRSIGEIKSASTSPPTEKKSDKQEETTLKKGKETEGKKWSEKITPKKPIKKGVAIIKAVAIKTSPPPQKSEVQKTTKTPTKKEESKPPEKKAVKPTTEPKKDTSKIKGVAKLKAAAPKKSPKAPKKPPVKKPPTKGR